MATALKSRLPYHLRIFLLVLGFALMLMTCFVLYQYKRERLFKAEKLNSTLQLFNMRLLNMMDDGVPVEEIMKNVVTPFEGMRVSVIDNDGVVLFDNMGNVTDMGNHLDRPEVIDAIHNGMGYQAIRYSKTISTNYFYSAMEGENVVVRTAVPYSVSLREVLAADSGFLWFMISVTLFMSVVGYYVAYRVGSTISSLSHFVERVQNGEAITVTEPFPNDELGKISRHIVQLYAKFQQATEELKLEHKRALYEEQEKIRIKKQLTNNINHELKTPIAVIQACLETLMTHPEIEEHRKQEFIEQCYANSERLCQMLNDVATITRMDEASRLISMEPVDLNDVIFDVADELQVKLEQQNMQLHIEMEEHISVCGNNHLLASVFRNLMSNSLSYSGGHNITIRLLENTPDYCRLSFSDDGQGVAPEHVSHLFERFYRVDKGRSRKLGGTGLGLSIVKNVILLHGGTISVRLGESGGLEFVFSIAKHLPEEKDVAEKQPSK